MMINIVLSRSGGMADALDSKSNDGNIVRVQVPPSASILWKKTNELKAKSLDLEKRFKMLLIMIISQMLALFLQCAILVLDWHIGNF